MKKILNLSYGFASRTVLLLSALLLLAFGLGVLTIKAQIVMDPSETILFSGRGLFFYLSFLISGLLLYGFARGSKSLSEKQLFLLFSVVYLFLGVGLILGVEAVIRSDAEQVYLAAKSFNLGDWSALTDQTGYLYANPHQLGLVSFERILLAISQDIRFLFLVYLLLTLGINALQWQVAVMLFPEKDIPRWSLLFSFLFLPQLFFILFLYGSQPGLFFVLLAVYAFLKYEQGRPILFLVSSVIALCVACLIRNNYLIFAITLGIVCLLLAIRRHCWRWVGVASCMLISVLLSQQLLTKWYEGEVGREIFVGTPKVAYLAMGLRDQSPTNGYWDAYNTNLLAQYHYDYEKAEQAAKQELTERLLVLRDNPFYAVGFFREKVMATWLEPTFQSIWSGPLYQLGQDVKGGLLNSLYKGETAYQFVHLFMSLLLAWLYLLAGLGIARSIVKKEPVSPQALYPLIFFLGGFCFHLLWETKSQYVYLYVYLLIPWSAKGLQLMLDYLNQFLSLKNALSTNK